MVHFSNIVLFIFRDTMIMYCNYAVKRNIAIFNFIKIKLSNALNKYIMYYKF